MNNKLLEVGQKFYYTGDMANNPDQGEIIEVLEPTRYTQLRYRAKMAGGKEKIIEAISFNKSIGQRFKTVQQVEEERQERNQQMQQFYGK